MRRGNEEGSVKSGEVRRPRASDYQIPQPSPERTGAPTLEAEGNAERSHAVRFQRVRLVRAKPRALAQPCQPISQCRKKRVNQ